MTLTGITKAVTTKKKGESGPITELREMRINQQRKNSRPNCQADVSWMKKEVFQRGRITMSNATYRLYIKITENGPLNYRWNSNPDNNVFQGWGQNLIKIVFKKKWEERNWRQHNYGQVV